MSPSPHNLLVVEEKKKIKINKIHILLLKMKNWKGDSEWEMKNLVEAVRTAEKRAISRRRRRRTGAANRTRTNQNCNIRRQQPVVKDKYRMQELESRGQGVGD